MLLSFSLKGMARSRTVWALGVLTGVYLILGSVYLFTTPPFEKPDEQWHYAYVAYIVSRGSLPPLVRDTALNPAQQIAGHPPLFYVMAAGVARLLALDLSRPLPPNNPFWAYPAPGTVPDNKNIFLHSDTDAYPAVWLLRGLSLLFGAALVPLTFALARELKMERRLALLSAALIALHPQYLFIAGSVSNDALVTGLSALAVWMLLRALPDATSWRAWWLFGVAAGLAAAAKTNAIVLPALGAVTAAWLAIERRDWRVALRGVSAGLGGWLLIAGGWYARNLLQFGDVLGVAVHTAPFPQGAGLTLADVPQQLAVTSITFWAAFGWTNVLLPDWAYSGWHILEIAALAGLLVAGPALWRERSTRAHYGIIAIFLLLMIAAYVWWVTRLHGTLGRLLFPALAPLSILMMLGLRQLWRGLPYVAVIYTGTMALLGPTSILPAYRPPALLTELPPDIGPLQLNVGDFAQLAGASIFPPVVQPGEEVTAILCWRARARTAAPQTVFVQLVGEGTYVAGARNTYPGLGRYATTLWQPGALFCDEVAVPVNADAPAPARYVVHVGMFDLTTGRRAPVTAEAGTPLSVIEPGAVKVAGRGPDIPAGASPVEAEFVEPIRLRAFELEPLRAGQTAAVTLYWEATGAPSADYTVFVHLLAADDNLAAQADAPPGSDAHAGRYPTSWWAAGEIIRDVHPLPLPTGLPPGDYRLRVGLYVPETGERVLLVSGADAVELGAVNVAP
ncbi:MAG: DUF2142 domain-containing protein [Anaerolineales bacterium]|nr:DUF2142 domain-containing protein [Anaerolineales bacterium]